MKELNLELTGYKGNDNLIVKIDGAPAKLKNVNGKLVCNYKTENETAKIEIFRLLNVGGIFWFLTQLFFFLISLFGLLGTHYKEKCLIIDFEIEIELKEKNDLSLQLYKLEDKKRAVAVRTNLYVKEKSNVAVVETDAKRVYKILNISKIILAVAIMLGVLLIIKK